MRALHVKRGPATALLCWSLLLPAAPALAAPDLQLAPARWSGPPPAEGLLHASSRRPGAAGFATEREGTLRLGGSFGLLAASGFTGFALRAQGSYALSEIDPHLFFDLAGHVGLALASGSQIFEFVPIARLRYQVKERLGLYGDGGFGLAIAHASARTDLYGYRYGGDTEVGALLRFSGGLQYALTPRLLFTFEPLGLHVYINGSGSTFAYSLLLGLLVRAG